MWLHANYRGEAPFLRAWGLDIRNPDDRAFGIEILEDLMQVEEGEEEDLEGETQVEVETEGGLKAVAGGELESKGESEGNGEQVKGLS